MPDWARAPQTSDRLPTIQPIVSRRAAIAFMGSGGVRIAGDRWGDDAAPPILLLHGGGQTRHSWSRTAAALADAGWQVVTLDARGHGESDWSPDGDYRLTSFALDVLALIETLPSAPVIVGASLGGLTTMLLAGELAPGCAKAVVLVDIVPDMESRGAGRIQDFMTERAESGFDSIEEVAAMVAAYNPHRARPTDLNGLRRNLRERDGRLYWHWDPRFIGGGGLAPTEIADTDRLHRAIDRMVDDTPVLLVRGRMSDLVSESKATEFLDRFPAVSFADVSDAGHMVAGDHNDAFTRVVLDFVAGR